MEDHKVPQASIAEAAARRLLELAPLTPPAQRLKDHERRQKFRRLIDPGIMRPNSKEQAMASLNTLFTIAENLIKEPDNPKYKQFKPTNQRIQRDLVNPKGALEYAIEMGFEAKVRDFQPFYVHNARRMEDLHLGAAILGEVIELENEKVERETRAKKDAKKEAEAAALKVKIAFIDDRTTVALRDQRDRQQREAREEQARSSPMPPASPSHENTGDILGVDPPPYS